MRKIFSTGFLILTYLLIPEITPAQPTGAGISYAPGPHGEDLRPSALRIYSSSQALTADAAGNLALQTGTGEAEVLSRPSTLRLAEPENAAGSGGKSYLPVLYSALLPGTGEISLGYTWRGIALLTLEVFAWTGYLYYRDQGLDSREAYENYADTYWDMQKWIDHHPEVYPLDYTLEELEEIGRNKSGSGEWPGYIIWVSREEDKQHYYENIGKYDWYISGWADFDPEIDDPFMHDTELRDQYRAMRKESNDQLEDADKFIYISLGTLVFSILQTLFLVRSSEEAGGEDVSRNHFRFNTRPLGLQGAEVSLEYNFK